MWLSEISGIETILGRDGEFEILAPCTTQTDKKILTFFETPKYLNNINSNTNISCVICKSEHMCLFENESIGILCAEQPKLLFFKLHNELVKKDATSERMTIIGENCRISNLANIAATNVVIGHDVVIEEFVSIKENVSIGNNCIIRAGSIIGGQGFEFKRNGYVDILSVIHVGTTIIENDVEIKELCSIHQAVFSMDCTRIGEFSKIDANSHIGHATKLGKRVLIGSHGNLAGNVCVEDDVYIGPNVTISNRLLIGKRSRISLGSVVTKNVTDDITVTGNFAIDHTIFIKDLKERVDRNRTQ